MLRRSKFLGDPIPILAPLAGAKINSVKCDQPQIYWRNSPDFQRKANQYFLSTIYQHLAGGYSNFDS